MAWKSCSAREKPDESGHLGGLAWHVLLFPTHHVLLFPTHHVLLFPTHHVLLFPTHHVSLPISPVSPLPHTQRVDRVLAWLDLPSPLRPSFLSLYLEEPDESGHLGGPDTPLVAAAVKRVDGMLGRLLSGLDQRSRVISIEQFESFVPGLSPAWIDFSYPLLGIFLPQTDAQHRPGSAAQEVQMDAAAVVGAMRRAIKGGGVVNGEALKVYLREEFPAEFEFSGSDRIPAILALADEGYSVVYHHSSAWDGGMHGYDNRLPSMRSIFMARGPHFASHRRIPTFRNTELYNVIASILEIQPAPNNGSLSFPDTILV
ncbi:unnamed protein product [Closterium sp. NIES-53]